MAEGGREPISVKAAETGFTGKVGPKTDRFSTGEPRREGGGGAGQAKSQTGVLEASAER